MKTKQCKDCGVTVNVSPMARNWKRCSICGAIRKAERDREKIRRFRRLNLGSDPWYEYKEYESIEEKVQKVLDTWTWPRLSYIKTPVLNNLYSRYVYST